MSAASDSEFSEYFDASESNSVKIITRENSPERVISSVVPESDDFGDFSTVDAGASPASAIPSSTVQKTDDDFGDFDNAKPAVQKEDDDDFGTFNGTETVAKQSDAVNVQPSDDDFGDFSQTQQEVQPQPTVAQSQPVQQSWPLSFCSKEDYDEYLQKVFSDSDVSIPEDSVRKILRPPDVEPSRSVDDPGTDEFFVKNSDDSKLPYVINPKFSTEKWFPFLSKLQYDLKHPTRALSKFRWRRSNIRKFSMISLNIPFNLDEVPVSSSFGPRNLRRSMSSSELNEKPNSPEHAISATESSPAVAERPSSVNSTIRSAIFSGSKTDESTNNFYLNHIEELLAVKEKELLMKPEKELLEMKNLFVKCVESAESSLKHHFDEKKRLTESISLNKQMIEGLVQRAQQARQTKKDSSPVKAFSWLSIK